MSYDTYLISRVGTFRFPVAPMNVVVNGEKHYETVDIMDRGEIDYLTRAKRIKTLDMECVIPLNWQPYCQYHPIPDQMDALQMLESMNEGGSYVRLIITDFPFNAMVNFAGMTIEQDATFVGDKKANLSFRIVTGTGGYLGKRTIERVLEPSDKPKLRNNRAPLERPKTYYIKGQDDLWRLAKRMYGDGREYNRIMAANGIKDARSIKNGQKIILP